MSKFEHSRTKTDVNIHKIENGILTGVFFNQQPKVGDFIKSYTFCRGGYKLKVTEILSQKDAIIQKKCTHNPSNAKMELKVIEVLDN